MQVTNYKRQNWCLLFAIGMVCFAGSLSVASECGLLKLRGPHEIVKKVKSRSRSRRGEEGGLFL